MPTCTQCLEDKPREAFHKHNRRPSGIWAQCKECRNKYVKEWRSRNPDRNYEQQLLKHYGMTLEEYRRKSEAQGGCCALCGKLPVGRSARLFVDHDHAHCPYGSGCRTCIRDLLCMRCNTAMGSAGDDPALLRKMARYIERHRRRIEHDD